MASETLGRLLSQAELKIIPMRSDQAHSAFQFGRASTCQFLQERRRQRIGIAGALREINAGTVGDGSRPRRRGQQLVGLFHLGRQLIHQFQACRHQLSAMGGEVTVPDVEGLQQPRVGAVSAAGGGFQ